MIDSGPNSVDPDSFFDDERSYYYDPFSSDDNYQDSDDFHLDFNNGENEVNYFVQSSLLNNDNTTIAPDQVLPSSSSNSSNSDKNQQNPIILKECSFRGSTCRSSKTKVRLSDNQQDFKDNFYQMFTSKKKFDKKLVRGIHNNICAHFNFKKMTRDQYRMIDLYFKEYAKYSQQILIYLRDNKEEILKLVLGLSDVKK